MRLEILNYEWGDNLSLTIKYTFKEDLGIFKGVTIISFFSRFDIFEFIYASYGEGGLSGKLTIDDLKSEQFKQLILFHNPHFV